MFALMSAVGDVGGWTLDEDRAACESMHPGHYIKSSYYEHWLNGLEILLQKHGLATAEEIASGEAAAPRKRVTPTPPKPCGPRSPRRAAMSAKVSAPPLSSRATACAPASSTRGTTRGCRAICAAMRARSSHAMARMCFRIPMREGRGEDPRHLYTVRFSAADVWGKHSRDVIHADLWEPYLEAV